MLYTPSNSIHNIPSQDRPLASPGNSVKKAWEKLFVHSNITFNVWQKDCLTVTLTLFDARTSSPFRTCPSQKTRFFSFTILASILTKNESRGCLSSKPCSQSCMLPGWPLSIYYYAYRFLFNVSGAGKSRLSLEGLCEHWGIYLTCESTSNFPSGSRDFTVATDILQEMGTWNADSDTIKRNAAAAADRVFAMILCARIFILNQLLNHTPSETDVRAVRKRWVLLQIMPAHRRFHDDIFVEVLRSLRYADTDTMRELFQDTVSQFTSNRKDLFPVEDLSGGPFFLVIDEAQVTANQLN